MSAYADPTVGVRCGSYRPRTATPTVSVRVRYEGYSRRASRLVARQLMTRLRHRRSNFAVTHNKITIALRMLRNGHPGLCKQDRGRRQERRYR